jgi:alkylation response protein AidB-like acyl-CoA dehydrogenase
MPGGAVEELFAAPSEVAGHPAVRAAAAVGARVLEPHAAAADDPALGVDPVHLRRLADAGLMSVRAPVELGGHGADPRVHAEVEELLSGSCGATWFVLTQHESPAGLCRGAPATVPADAVELGPAASLHRAELARADRTAGVAVAHLRRPGRPAITATPDGAGYRLSGRAHWCTGWGLLDLVTVAAALDAGTAGERFVFALLPARPRRGLRAGPPLPLSVMGGTRTVALTLDELPVRSDQVLLTVDARAWRRHDAWTTANVKPAAVGLLRRALVELERAGHRRAGPPPSRWPGGWPGRRPGCGRGPTTSSTRRPPTGPWPSGPR